LHRGGPEPRPPLFAIISCFEKPMISHRRIHLLNFCRKLAVNAVFFLIPLHFLKNGFIFLLEKREEIGYSEKENMTA
jgi:hypothetical protein